MKTITLTNWNLNPKTVIKLTCLEIYKNKANIKTEDDFLRIRVDKVDEFWIKTQDKSGKTN